jgi:hypothetical protein
MLLHVYDCCYVSTLTCMHVHSYRHHHYNSSALAPKQAAQKRDERSMCEAHLLIYKVDRRSVIIER